MQKAKAPQKERTNIIRDTPSPPSDSEIHFSATHQISAQGRVLNSGPSRNQGQDEDSYEFRIPDDDEISYPHEEQFQSATRTDLASTAVKVTHESSSPPNANEIFIQLGMLNETAIELIGEQRLNEALDQFAEAETILDNDNLESIPEPYIATLYYNMAFFQQKMGVLDQCGDYLCKSLVYLERYVSNTDPALA